jgi:hypothetical protein
MTWSADEAIPRQYGQQAHYTRQASQMRHVRVPTTKIEQRIVRRSGDGLKTAEIRYFSTITAVLSLTLAGSVPVAFTPGFSET